MDADRETVKNELVETYRFLLAQSSRIAILDAWLQESIERRKAISFIQSKGLYAEYLRVNVFK